MPPRPRCLIAFDAFGTLFSPRAPIGTQYVDVATAFLGERYSDIKAPLIDAQEFEETYKNAFQQHWKSYPNYGKETDMGPETWWKTLIRTTLDPFLRNIINETDWEHLSQALWTRFASNKGYAIHEDSRSLLEHLKASNTKDVEYIVGVISNSDPRVSKVLQSLDLIVSPVGANTNDINSVLSKDNHIQFIITSYEAGVAKPQKAVFDIAETTARRLLPVADQNEELVKIFVGDEYEKDGLPAIQAGWNSVLVDRTENDKLSRHFPYLDLLTYPNEANPQSGKPLFLQRVQSLWPFHPHILSTAGITLQNQATQ